MNPPYSQSYPAPTAAPLHPPSSPGPPTAPAHLLYPGTPPPAHSQATGNMPSPRMNPSSSPHPRAMTPGRTPSPGSGSSSQPQPRPYSQQQRSSSSFNKSASGGAGAGANTSAADLTQALLPPGSAALLDLIDKRVLVLLRDGRLLVGILRSYDHFANLVFQDTVERIAAADVFGDIDRGVFVVRGENVVMLGEVDGDVEDALPMREVPVEEALALQRIELDARRAKDAVDHPALHRSGFCVDFDPNDMY